MNCEIVNEETWEDSTLARFLVQQTIEHWKLEFMRKISNFILWEFSEVINYSYYWWHSNQINILFIKLDSIYSFGMSFGSSFLKCFQYFVLIIFCDRLIVIIIIFKKYRESFQSSILIRLISQLIKMIFQKNSSDFIFKRELYYLYYISWSNTFQ